MIKASVSKNFNNFYITMKFESIIILPKNEVKNLGFFNNKNNDEK